AAWLME
ncbi:hypothetical protein HKBW3S09_00216, partial [Candidatus Hakubella thermalkaliphila]